MRPLGFLLALCALIAAGCGGGSSTEDATRPAVAANRSPAPPIEGQTLDGERISLADYRGRTVFVNVWSSW